ncbi:hypothetical protein Pmar_PMAR022248 [Perkinsus marinus ATCC 50983]|uniref:Uncharacterized protein n=1 Tax=Perkinsus marinus (strain ATCC 50983 / TXsc) TaxID=423536 RepID=C5KDK9_PERM5|nr:hypothetical protein Pmar_PMAR022248 [Perkinsus marinus ATCC 50983]EER17312.1 hypothetical protein Pmar_PMAR022248 [Perkinsus marinus ATCC 50983]|eukprot:XP_002785516.1 hypothetical protein Pmar_PMAR022248 [Perkinsus marinus ATCC 50983]
MTTSKSSNKTPDREGNGSRVIPMDENTQREFIKNMNNIIQEGLVKLSQLKYSEEKQE